MSDAQDHIKVFGQYKKRLEELRLLIGDPKESQSRLLASISEENIPRVGAIIDELLSLVPYPARYRAYLAPIPCSKTHLCDVQEVKFVEDAKSLTSAFQVFYYLVDERGNTDRSWKCSTVLEEFLKPRAGLRNFWLHDPTKNFTPEQLGNFSTNEVLMRV